MAKKKAKRQSSQTKEVTLDDAMAWLQRKGTKKQIAELQRYGITANEPFGVSVGEVKKYGKGIGTDHKLALQLWSTTRYEAQLLAAFVDDPEKVTIRQMNQWARGFDNWAIVDSVCFHLFDRTAHAWTQVRKWAKAKPEFTKRTAFALLWSLSVHDKSASDEQFLSGLDLIERNADDDRNFVKKAVNMALRAIGKRNAALNVAATATAERLAASDMVSARWVGKNAIRELKNTKTLSRLK
jgi:3-methyladenine DNA glycosylase AlkD